MNFLLDTNVVSEWPLAPMDAFIAAIVEVHGLTLVTRNVADFKASVKLLVNPWSA